jgi:formylglycine-generating enzyme required for sulfatase activity
LDKYEVTVGRFRAFVAAYDGETPDEGEGAVASEPGSGWLSSYDTYVTSNADELLALLKCDPDDEQLEAWTDEPGNNETLPINCVDWWTAFQFCVWDGARLPTEAEWEFAAAGGTEDRLYPWGMEEPSCSRAQLDDCGNTYIAEVGAHPSGQGRYGHMDLAGNVYEWTLDHYTDGYLERLAQLDAPPVDPVDLGDEDWRSIRSSHMFDTALNARNTSRQASHPVFLDHRYGIRCARGAQ